MSDPIEDAKRRYAEARGRQSASRTVLFQAIPNWPDLPDMLTHPNGAPSRTQSASRTNSARPSTRWLEPAELARAKARFDR
jgi:hypothetical protein